MRKVTFYIDDVKYFRNQLKNAISQQEIDEITDRLNSFVAIYTLYGNDKIPDKFELTDCNGEKIKINSLNGYQKGIIINDCMAYFSGGSYFNGASEPCGVIKIEESVI